MDHRTPYPCAPDSGPCTTYTDARLHALVDRMAAVCPEASSLLDELREAAEEHTEVVTRERTFNPADDVVVYHPGPVPPMTPEEVETWLPTAVAAAESQAWKRRADGLAHSLRMVRLMLDAGEELAAEPVFPVVECPCCGGEYPTIDDDGATIAAHIANPAPDCDRARWGAVNPYSPMCGYSDSAVFILPGVRP